MDGRFTNRLWTDAPKGMSDFQLMHTILTAARTPKEFTPDEGLLRAVAPVGERIRVLDFGCGMGRNLKWAMEHTSWEVTGYDNDQMLERARKWLPTVSKKPLPTLISSWESLREKKFDAVIATLVFQHIYRDELSGYLKDLRAMTSRLFVHSRRVNDDGTNTLETISKFFHLHPIRRRSEIELGRPLGSKPRHAPRPPETVPIAGPIHGHLTFVGV
jgi:SAM-dependent methyltransferase